MKMVQIKDLSDHGRKPSKKSLKYEVAVCHDDTLENPEVVAKFKAYGDAQVFARHISEGNVFYFMILIRS